MSDAPESGSAKVTETSLPDADGVVQYLQWGLLALLVLFGLAAAVGLYTSVGRIIQVWVASEFQPVFNAAFNLLVLLLVAAGITGVLRRLS